MGNLAASHSPLSTTGLTDSRQAAEGILVHSVWSANPPLIDDAALANALHQARRNRVAGRLAQAYPDRLQAELRRIDRRREAFRRNLESLARRLVAADVNPIVIKAHLDVEDPYGNFDVVVGEERWEAAVAVLKAWSTGASTYALEPDKILFHPASGPAAHLHRSVSWFGIPIISTTGLRRRAIRPDGGPWWTPAPVDALRIALAHVAFQNLALDLADLLVLRGLLDEAVLEAARVEADAEGWRRGFEAVLAVAENAIALLDAQVVVNLPIPVSPWSGLAIGLEHAGHLLRTGRKSLAVRETTLRGPLVAAKGRRVRRGRDPTQAIGISGPDGAGKTTAVDELANRLRAIGASPVRTYVYGCVFCRNAPSPMPLLQAAPHGTSVSILGSSSLRQIHALIDVVEFTTRFALARTRARLQARRRAGTPVVLTERSPLDGLAKHDPTVNSLVARWYLALARRYELIVRLDASGNVLAARDHEHWADELERSRRCFAAWSQRLPNVVRIETGGVTKEQVAKKIAEELARQRLRKETYPNG